MRNFLSVWILFLLHDYLPGTQVSILKSFVSFFHLYLLPYFILRNWLAFLEGWGLLLVLRGILEELFHMQMNF